MASKEKAKDLEVGIMIVQPTKRGIEEIAHNKIRVPYLENQKGTRGKGNKIKNVPVEKPIHKKVVRGTRAEEQ